MTRALVVVYDVSNLSEAELASLELEAAVQGEASDYEEVEGQGRGHPDVAVLSVVIEAPMQEVYERVQRG